MNCTQKVMDTSIVLSTRVDSIQKRKENLKNIIFNHISNNYADFDPSLDIDMTMTKIIKKVEERLKEGEKENTYCSDIIFALITGMGLVQDSPIYLLKSHGKDRIAEPIYSYNKDGLLESITIRSRESMYKSLLQIAKYFDNRFMTDNMVRTLRK